MGRGVSPSDGPGLPLPPDRGPQRVLYAGRATRRDALPTPRLHRQEVHGEVGLTRPDRFIHGDVFDVAGGLLAIGEGDFDLVYLDPPFDSARPWRRRVRLRGPRAAGGPGASRGRVALAVEAYSDAWSGDAYLAFLADRIRAARAVLAPEGVLALHCDVRRVHHLRTLCEEVFGPGGFVNEITWRRRPGRANTGRRLDQVTDRILVFANGNNHRFTRPHTCESEEARRYIARRFTGRSADGRPYMTTPLSSPNPRKNLKYIYEGHEPPPNGWSISREKMAAWHAAGRLHFVPGGRIYRKIYRDEYPGQPVTDLWTDLPVVNSMASERLDFPTQKPEALLQRLLETFSEAGDRVLDGFAGSGTAATVAARLGREVVAVDASPEAIRLVALRRRWEGEVALARRGFVLESTGVAVARGTVVRSGEGVDLPDLRARLDAAGVEVVDPRELLLSVSKGPMEEGVYSPVVVSDSRDPASLVSLDLPPGPGAVQVVDLLLRSHWVDPGDPGR